MYFRNKGKRPSKYPETENLQKEISDLRTTGEKDEAYFRSNLPYQGALRLDYLCLGN